MNPSDRPTVEAPDQELIFGRFPVLEALKAGEAVAEILVADGAERRGPLAEIDSLARRAHIPIHFAPRGDLDRLAAQSAGPGRRAANHQGVIAFAPPFAYADLDQALAIALKREEPPWLLVLDAIQDVHNLGSLLRTAEAVGVHGVLITERGGPGITPAVRKASAGAVGYLPIIREELAGALDRLHRRGVVIVGLDGSAELDYDAPGALDGGPMALVVGGEGSGLSHAVRRRCDRLLKLPMRGHVASLNAAVAGSIALYAVLRARSEASDSAPVPPDPDSP